jgi:mxaA protein
MRAGVMAAGRRATLVWLLAVAGGGAAWAQPGSSAATLAPGTSAAVAASAPGPRLVTQVIQPRAFGHVLGDVLVQRVLLEHAGRRLVPTALPPADRVGRWFERRTPRIERDAQGRDWLVIEHQLINAPRLITATALPAIDLKTGSGEVLAVPAWPLSIGPLTLAESPGLQGDRPVLLHDSRGIESRLQASLGALVAVLLAWAGWWAWRHWRESQRLPFALAARQVRRLDAGDPAAWQALHAAINRSAGRVVHAASLPEWLAEAPHLQPLRGELEAFFAASNTRFFGAADAAPAMALRPLAQALRAAERRHRR